MPSVSRAAAEPLQVRRQAPELTFEEFEMPRRHVAAKRKILPDPKYQDRLVTKFVNDLMRKGKKSIAEAACYGAFAIIEDRAKETRSRCSRRPWTT
jgi:hypothetical protein